MYFGACTLCTLVYMRYFGTVRTGTCTVPGLYVYPGSTGSVVQYMCVYRTVLVHAYSTGTPRVLVLALLYFGTRSGTVHFQ